MTKYILILVAIALVTFNYALDSNLQPYSTQSFKVISQHSDYVDIEFNLPAYKITDEVSGGVTYQHFTVDSALTTIDTGMPEFPRFSTLLAIPYKGSVRVELISSNTSTIENHIPYPCQNRLEDQSTPKAFQVNTDFYSSGSSYPSQSVLISEPKVIRDFRVVSLDVVPFTFSPQSQQVRVMQKVQVRIHFEKTRGVNEMDVPTQYSRSFEKIYESMILNYNDFRDSSIPLQPKTVLMIYPTSTDTNFNSALANFVAWKSQKGYDVKTANTTATGTTNTSIKAYIQNAYNTWHNKPDYIILIGDVSGTFAIPTWNESFSGYSGEGDYPYTHLSGGSTDYLGDAFIGRISISNVTDFQTIAAKVYAYEKNPTLTGTDWYNHMVLVGDTAQSGISTVYTNKFIKEISTYHNPHYSYTEVYTSPFSSLINTAINQGSSFFNYRGWIGMSGWSPGSAGLVNGNKLVHAVIITCATGNFSGGTATTEEFIRLGTSTTLKGAITAIGMCTSHTHTMLNNCLDGGIFDGIFTHDMHTMGEALLNGKLYLDKIYGVSNTNLSNTFAHWCNLMGDPTVQIYTKVPDTFNVVYPSSIPQGTSQVDVTVNDANGLPVKEACVTLYQASTLNLIGYTDVNGHYTFDLLPTLTGSLIFTANKDNYAPSVMNSISIDATGSLVYETATIGDANSSTTSGNGNGVAEAGETIGLWTMIKNTMDDFNPVVSGVLSVSDPYVTLQSTLSQYGTIQAGASVTNQTPYLVHIQPSVPDYHKIRFSLVLQDQQSHTYQLYFDLLVRNANIVSQSIVVADEVNSILDPGETANLVITLKNSGATTITGLNAVLHSTNSMITVNDSLATYGNFAPGSTVTNTTDALSVSARLQLIPGMMIPLELVVSNADGFSQIVNFNLPIGQVTVDDPLGPDEYGYVIYDMGDTSYPDCPQYNWIGIAPAEGGTGAQLAFNDSGSSGTEGDATGALSMVGVDLPFTFSFYGQLYSHITVCSNGFIAMGTSEDGEFRNYRLPGAIGPNPMIAAFWDDLMITSGGGVYKYYDPTQHYMVIEWYHAVNGYNESSEETFQVILYDPSYYPTSLGDGLIKIQYKVFNNVDVGSTGYSGTHGNYASIGIKDHTGRRGLEYTFDNVYPVAAQTLSNQKALIITGPPIMHEEPHLLLNETVIHDANNNHMVEPGELIEMGIRLSNMGESAATSVNATIAANDPYVTIISASSAYNPIPGESTGINRNYFTFQVASNCPNDHVIIFTVNITANGYNWQRYASVRVAKPQIAYTDTYINDLLNGANGNGKADPDENVKLILNLSNNGVVDATNTHVVLTSSTAGIVIADSTFNQFTVPAQKNTQKVFDVYIPANLTPNTYVPFSYTITADNSSPVTGSFTVGVSTSGLALDFESNNGGFVSSGGWTWGVPSGVNAHSGTHVWGTSLSGNYPDNAHYELTTSAISLGANASLTFWHRYGFEQGWDGGNVKISTNNGQSFTLLTPNGGYNDDSINSLNEPGYTGTLSNWALVTIPLTQITGGQILIKWTMGSDSSQTGIGWFLDDVQITGFITSTGMIYGDVEVPPVLNVTDALVSAGSFTAHPNANGSYALFVQNGTYPVSIQMPYCQQIPTQNVTISAVNNMNQINFNMNYLAGTTIAGNISNTNVVSISWSTPVSSNSIQYYTIHRQDDADLFHTIADVTDTTYTDSLAITGQYRYYVTAHYSTGDGAPSNTLLFNATDVENHDPNPSVPITKLYGNYPNPFNPETNISFSLDKSTHVSLKVYNIKGQVVKVLAEGKYAAGYHTLLWNGKNDSNQSVASGVYFYRISTPGYTEIKKAILLK